MLLFYGKVQACLVSSQSLMAAHLNKTVRDKINYVRKRNKVYIGF